MHALGKAPCGTRAIWIYLLSLFHFQMNGKIMNGFSARAPMNGKILKWKSQINRKLDAVF